MVIFLISRPVMADEIQKWSVLPEESKITFKGNQMGSPFDGAVKSFTADIIFDINHLDQSHVQVFIKTADIDAQDSERNKALAGSEWLDIAQFPEIKFLATAFKKIDDFHFETDGDLTIRNITLPLHFPFTLTFSDDKAVMDASVTLNRSLFKLGTGEWADPSIIANEVAVHIHLTARKNTTSTP